MAHIQSNEIILDMFIVHSLLMRFICDYAVHRYQSRLHARQLFIVWITVRESSYTMCAVVVMIRMERANLCLSKAKAHMHVRGIQFTDFDCRDSVFSRSNKAPFYTLRIGPFRELCGKRRVNFWGRCVFMFDCFQYQ